MLRKELLATDEECASPRMVQEEETNCLIR
jgi:hypothetical protein